MAKRSTIDSRQTREGRPIRKFPLAILGIILGLVLAGGAAGYLIYTDGQAQNTARVDPITMHPPGGPFTLTDHTGKKVTDKNYRGKFMLIAFGYTYCPDVCPTGLQDMSTVMDLLGKQADWLQPIFITIDPERDTPEILKDYVSAFHPQLIGLTGTQKQIADAAEKFRVYFHKIVPTQDKGEAKEVEDDDYSMGHTTSIHLVGIDGKGLAVFNFGMAATAVEKMVGRIRHFINIQEALARSGQNNGGGKQ